MKLLLICFFLFCLTIFNAEDLNREQLIEQSAGEYKNLALAFNTLASNEDPDSVKSLYVPLLQQIDDFIKEIKKIKFECDSDIDNCYRLDWIKAMTKTLHAATYQKINDKVFNFDQESFYFMDTVVPDIYYSKISKIRNKLKTIFDTDDETLSTTYYDYLSQFITPNDNYEQCFQYAFDKTIEKFETSASYSSKGATVELEFYNDATDSAEAWAFTLEGICNAGIKCNKARPIDINKVLQLSSHEGSHTVQFCVQTDYFNTHPETTDLWVYTIINFLLEGGAEANVDYVFPHDVRFNNLNTLAEFVGLSGFDGEKLLKVDKLTTRLWRSHIQIAKEFVNGEITKEECVAKMLKYSLKANNSWPNCDFFTNYRSLIISYGWGKYLIRKYLKTLGGDMFENWVNFSKKPLTPSRMEKILGIEVQHNFKPYQYD